MGFIQRHKPLCLEITEGYRQLEQSTTETPNGMTVLEYHDELTQWIHSYQSDLLAAVIHSLELPRDITHSETHILRMRIAQPPPEDHAHGPFHLLHAEVMQISAASELGGLWTSTLRHFTEMRNATLAAGGPPSAAICVECEPFDLQLIPFGSLKHLDTLKVNRQWLDVLKFKLNGRIGCVTE
ncbi:hypothetical protein NLJ89_g8393 [Agrocybe chaxingu]|uniref:Uncharacterized protein n=1 Tax=Agrocybe chaxingu TaxID=84603 RepID=A0A9W8MS71_9AGAR|nr:hypothetical protein NLJ89_g8393 [Agrocybe chaxingu]